MPEHTGDRRGRAGVQRSSRTLPEAFEIGGTAVPPHDHHGGVDPRSGDTGGHDVGGPHRDRENGGVERRGDSAEFQAVQARHLRRGAHREAGSGGDLGDHRFVRRVLGRERLGDARGTCSGSNEALDDALDLATVEPVAHVDELAERTELLARRQLDVVERRALAGLPQIGPAPHADDPDRADVTLEQRVDGLRGRVGHEGDRAPVERRCDVGDGPHHPLGNSVRVFVRGGDHRLGDDAGGVDGHRLREGAAHVDADADCR